MSKEVFKNLSECCLRSRDYNSYPRDVMKELALRIPKGWDAHCIDGNMLNTTRENFIAVPEHVHQAAHAANLDRNQIDVLIHRYKMHRSLQPTESEERPNRYSAERYRPDPKFAVSGGMTAKEALESFVEMNGVKTARKKAVKK